MKSDWENRPEKASANSMGMLTLEFSSMPQLGSETAMTQHFTPSQFFPREKLTLSR